MTGNGTSPPKGGTAKETPMRFPTSRTATDKRVDLLWKPPHTPRARALLDRAERNAEAMSKSILSRDVAAKTPSADGSVPEPDPKVSGKTGDSPGGDPTAG
jgi:hypothetical protein